ICRALEDFHLSTARMTTRAYAPRGAGLGGSSALAITLVRALSELAGKTLEGDELIFLVRDLETRLLGVPAGIQDYYPPTYGGLAAIHLEPGNPVRHAIGVPIGDLASHMLLHYAGVAHFSGTNNWEMYKRQVQGMKKVQKGFAKIAATSIEMEHALETGDWEAAGRALAKEWTNRKALIDGISTVEVEAAIDAATSAGAWGGKVCGAGGGGCVVFLMPPEKRDEVTLALAKVPGHVLDAQPVAHGMTITRDDATQSSSAPARSRIALAARSGTIDQLYVSGGAGDYHPYVLAESAVTHSEPRSGLHHTIIRSYIASMSRADGKVDWSTASQIDAEKLDIRAVPDPNRELDIEISPE